MKNYDELTAVYKSTRVAVDLGRDRDGPPSCIDSAPFRSRLRMTCFSWSDEAMTTGASAVARPRAGQEARFRNSRVNP